MPITKPSTEPVEAPPPGPLRLEVRINDRTAITQRVYSYRIDQRPDSIHIHGELRPTDEQPQ